MTADRPEKRLRHRNNKPVNTSGFSLIEIVIAVALLMIVTTGSVLMFNITIRQNNQSKGKQEEQSAISGDLAAIQTLNDRYSCTAASASSAGCSVSGSDPNEDGYYANVTAPTAASDSFDLACRNGSLITSLISSVNELAVPAAFTRLGITRSAAATTVENNRSPLRYTVTWTKDSGSVQLRQITLVPTVANWCP